MSAATAYSVGVGLAPHVRRVRLIHSIVNALLSPGERGAVRALLAEREIAANHRRGLREVRRGSNSKPARLNLGSGHYRKVGFLNVDVEPGRGDITLDLRRELPFESNACELVVAEHCFEHFDYPEPIGQLFRECLRVLRPGGCLRFSVPDSEWPLSDYRDGLDAPYFKACTDHGWHPRECTTRLEHINYHFRQDNEHRFAYDFETAEKALRAAGFVNVHRVAFDPTLDSEHRETGSLFVSAYKPGVR